MMRLVARVSGRIKMAGYRARVAALARGFGFAGFVKNVSEDRRKI